MLNDLMNHRLALRIAGVVLVFAFVFAYCSSFTLAIQPKDGLSKPEITIRAERNSVQIADPFDIVIQVTASDNAAVRFPTLPPQLGPFEVIDHHDLMGVPSEANKGTANWSRRLTLETLETGDLKIPSIEVVVRNEGKPLMRVATEPLSIEVASVLEPASDPAKFADIHDLIDVPEPKAWSYGWIVWLAGGGIGLAALVAGAVFVFRGRTNWTTPANWAVSEISGLTSNSPQSFSRLENIARTYIEEEFHIPATSYSPQELQQAVIQRGASQGISQHLVDFLTKAEQTKYAGLNVSDSQFTSAKESILQVIEGLDNIPEDKSLGSNAGTINAEVV